MSAVAASASDDGLAAGFWGGLLAGLALVALGLWWLVTPVPGTPRAAVAPATPVDASIETTAEASLAATERASEPTDASTSMQQSARPPVALADAVLTDQVFPPIPAAEYPRVEPAWDERVDGDPINDMGRWTALWQPFRSPVSARGFAERLAVMTGFDYQVVSEGADRHRVNVRVPFGSVEADVLADIEAGTGLAMGRSQ